MDLFHLKAVLGLDTSEYEKGIGNAKSALSGIGSAMGTIGKVGAAAVGVAATAVGALATESVNAYKDYEQLEGGIQTLFGNAAPKVMENAEKAFKTAGQSMNDYMDTSIQSAAALIKSLEGDQAKAADLMDMSITDMSDNVNKMGTSMEAVQNAYRGFSRGNFTMLDNLALGFAGTKEGMQELLDKAKEISGVEYNIDSYADIVKAIHTVQGEMEISGRSAEDVAEIFEHTGKRVEESLGTTAKEGVTTLEGSLTTLKGAWANLVAGFGKDDVNLDQLIDQVVNAAETVFENIQPIIEKAINGISEFISKAAPIIAEELPKLIDNVLPSLLDAATNLVTAIAGALPGLISSLLSSAPEVIASLMQAGFDMILDLAHGLTDPGAMQNIMDAIISIIEEIGTWISEYANVLVEAAVNIIIALVEGLTNPDGISRLIDTAVLLITSLLEALLNAAPQIMEAAPVIILNLVQAIVQNVPKILEAAVQIIQGFVSGLSTNLPQVIQSGIEILMAIITGLIQALPEIISTSLQIIGEIKGAFANVDWLQLGADIIAGIIKGIANGAGALVDAVKGAAKKALDGAKSFLGIKSPSRVFRDQIGKMVDAGLAEGIEDNTGYVEDAMGALSDATTNNYAPDMDFSSGMAMAMAGGYGGADGEYGDIVTAITDALMNMQLVVNIGNRPIEAMITSAQQQTTYRSGGR